MELRTLDLAFWHESLHVFFLQVSRDHLSHLTFLKLFVWFYLLCPVDIGCHQSVHSLLQSHLSRLFFDRLVKIKGDW